MGKKAAIGVFLPEPEEDVEQMALFRWAAYNRGRWPELDLMFHVPNGGKRSKAEAKRFKDMGVKAGVSDVFLPVARNGCHGLWIEMKRLRSGRPTADQIKWIENMIKQGYAATVCHGWEQAVKVIEEYMGGGRLDIDPAVMEEVVEE